MFDKFCDYMYYLLTSPFKRVSKTANQWYILFKVLGNKYDDAMEGIYKAREETMLATCSDEMIPIHADDRNMTRYLDETPENFRKRIANYAEVCRAGGTNPGVLLAVRTLGYLKSEIKPAKEITGDDTRWAEFYLIVTLNVDEEHPIGLNALQKEVRKTKEVGAKDNYLFNYTLAIEQKNLIEPIRYEEKFGQYTLNGQYQLNGYKKLNAYEVTEDDIEMKYVTTLKRREKLAEASNNTGTLAKAKWIALGIGGVDENGEIIEPLAESIQLKNEIVRKEYVSSYKSSATSYEYVIRLNEEELVGKNISEIALIDEEEDVIAFSNIKPKCKDNTQVEFTIKESF